MACVLTTGFDLDCKDAIGGIDKIYITELANKSTLTVASGVVTVFTLAQGKQFFEYDLREETSSFVQNINANNQNGTTFYEQVVTAYLDPLEVNRRNEVLLLVQNDLMVIIKDENDVYWLIGQNTGVYFTGGSAGTGTAKGDRSGFGLIMSAKEKELAPQVTEALIAVLTAPAA